MIIITSVYLIFYLSKSLFIKETPIVMNYIKKELKTLDLKIKHNFLSEKSFGLLTSCSLILLLLIDLRIIKTYNKVVYDWIQIILATLFFLNLIIPILLGFYYDRYKVQLINDYHIKLDVQYSLKKQKSQTFSIFMTSSRLSSKINPMGFKLYKKIIQYRWLPNKNNKFITKKRITPFLRFFEYSSLINFKYNLLNLALALKDWEEQFFRDILIFYQDIKTQRRTLEDCKYMVNNVNKICAILNT
jgi:hypothetical protein